MHTLLAILFFLLCCGTGFIVIGYLLVLNYRKERRKREHEDIES